MGGSPKAHLGKSKFIYFRAYMIIWIAFGLNIFYVYTLYKEQHIKTYNNIIVYKLDSEESLRTYTNLYPI